MGKATSEREAQCMRLVPGLRHEMPVKYIAVPNSSATRTFRAGTITVCDKRFCTDSSR